MAYAPQHLARRSRVRLPGFLAASVIGCLLMATATQAQPLGRIARVSVEHGLSQSTVLAVLRDHVGFLWFGTADGLNRFDGYSFVVYRRQPDDSHSLPHDAVSVVHEDRQQRLWVGTWGGLSRFDRDTETFTTVAGIRKRVTAIAQSADDTLWVATEGDGVYAVDPAGGVVHHYRHDADDPASIGSNAVSALAFDARGRLWIGTRDAGVDSTELPRIRLVRATADPGPRRFVHYRHDPLDRRTLSHNEIYGLAPDSAGYVWIATYGGGLSVYDPDTDTFRHLRHRSGDPGSLASDLITAVLIRASGSVAVGTDGAGLQQYDPDSGRFVTAAHNPGDLDSLSHDVVRTLYEDPRGQLWVGTLLGGANLLDRPEGKAFAHYTHRADTASSLANRVITAFLEDRQGRVWVGTEAGWVHRFDPRGGTFVRYRFPSGKPGGSAILALHEDGDSIWVGTYRGGLGRLDPDRGIFTAVHRHRTGDPDSLAGDEVWSTATSDSGGLWLATNAGLDHFMPALGRINARLPAASPEGPIALRVLLHDSRGDLWVGTKIGGLAVLKRGSTRLSTYRHDADDPGSLSDDGVQALFEDGDGSIWIGTNGGGLNRFNPQTGSFSVFQQFPSNVIHSIEEDSAGHLWVSTNRGLSRFDPRSERVENFDLTNGLRSLQFRLGASLRTRSGRLLFGSADGFYQFDPTALAPDAYAPPLVLTSLRLFNEPVRLSPALSTVDQLELSFRDKVFSLEFAALDHALPRRNRYAYRMEGLSDQWIQLGTRRDVTFTNLDPGRYIFKVRASNSDGVWSDNAVTTLTVIVRPPYWHTWWFRTASLAALGLLIFGVHRIRVRHLTADIAERKRAEAALRQAEEKYRGIVQNAVEGIFQSAQDGRLLTVNPAFAEMLGYESPEQMAEEVTNIGQQLYCDSLQRDQLLAQLERVGFVQGFELELRRRDGRPIWVSENVRVVRDEAGHRLYYEGTINDVSDRKRALDLQETLRRSETMSAMGSLVAGVAHEVRNPLFSISANLDVLDTEIATRQPCAETMEILHAEVSRLGGLMEDLLEFGRPLSLQRSREQLREIAQEAEHACGWLLKGHTVRISNDISSDLPHVSVDRRRIVQVFQNLVENAIQHSPPGGVVRLVAREAWSDEQPWVECEVLDSGPGFRAGDLAQLFTPFFTARAGGTGLGLSIVQRIAVAHGGSVGGGNRETGGARIIVRLPAGPDAAQSGRSQ